MTSASIIAELLHLDLFMVHESCGLEPVPHGWRLRNDRDTGRLLIVDDTVATGRSMERIKELGIKRDYILSAIYVSPEQRKQVELIGRLLPIPHYLEWNLFNSVYTASLGLDIDGILCPDPDPKWTDCKYEKYIQAAPLLQRPVRSVVPLIATGRKRRYRQHTEDWLATRGIRYEQLVFPQDDWELNNPGEMKARAYGESRATIFVESDPVQAELIAARTLKRVICPAIAKVYN
jgi:orotate phosphoribosyltransferase